MNIVKSIQRVFLRLRRFANIMLNGRIGSVMFAIDTSGSMHGNVPVDAIKQIIDKMYGAGKEVQIVLYSHTIERVYTYTGKLQIDLMCAGTDIDCVIEMFNKSNHEACFCVTDGYVQVTNAPNKMWAWLLCGNDDPENAITRELKQFGNIKIID